MRNSDLKNLVASPSRQYFVDQVGEILAPYGNVRRSQMLVDKYGHTAEVSYFVQMETHQQAQAARNALNLTLLGDDCLFFNIKVVKSFAD